MPAVPSRSLRSRCCCADAACALGRVRRHLGPQCDHDLQRPARTDDGGARGGVRKAERDQGEPCAAATRRRSATRSCRRARARPRTSSTRENTPLLGSARASTALLAPVAPATLARGARAATAPRRGCWVGVSARVSALVYNTSEAGPDAAAALDPRTGRARSGRASSASPPRRPTSSRSITAIAQARRAGRRRTLAEGRAGERHRLPGQRDRRRPGEQRRERARPDQPLLLVPPARASSAAGASTPRCTTTRPGDPGDARSTSRARPCCLEHRTRPTRSASSRSS